MTNADKTEIANLIGNIGEMRRTAEKMNEAYHDRKIAEYAKAAFDDARETTDCIVKTVNENLEMFFNLKHIELSTSHYSANYWVNLRDGNTLGFYFGKYMTITFRVDKSKVRNFTTDMCYKASFALTDNRGMEATFVRPYTSDTKNELRQFCAWDDLFYSSQGSMKYDLRGNYTPARWSEIKREAESTREQTRILLEDFKRVLRGLAASHKAKADKAEATRAENGNVKNYVKLTIAI